jgi:hypothetical protein
MLGEPGSGKPVGGIIAEVVFSCLAVAFTLPQHGADIIVCRKYFVLSNSAAIKLWRRTLQHFVQL